MRKNAAMLLLAIGVSACAAVTGSGSGREMQAGAEVGRIRLHAALQAGDMATVERMLAGAEIRVPPGTEPGQERAAVRAALGAEEVLLHPEGVARCTGALHEYGAFVVRTYDGPDEFAQLGRYALLWGRGPDDGVELRRIALFDVEEGRRYRNPPCVTVADSVFESRRVWVAIHPGRARGTWQDGLVESVYSTGWRPTIPLQIENEAQRSGTVMAQVSLRGPSVVAMSGSAMSGRTLFRSPTDRTRRLQYTGYHGGLGFGAEFRLPVVPLLRASVSSGPALLWLDGTWETPGRNTHEDDESWTAWSVGVASDVGVVVPLGPRLGVTARFQHRWYPDPEIPGHLGSDAFRTSFSHTAVLLGIGGRMW